MTITEHTRPLAITIVVVFIVLGAFANFAVVLFLPDKVNEIGTWVLPFSILFSFCRIIAAIGLWKMKKWSVFLYIVLSIVNHIVLLEANIWNFYTLLVSAFFIWILLKQYFKMA